MRPFIAVVAFAFAFAFAFAPGLASAQHGHGSSCDPGAVATPILSVADFDGNGVVDKTDQKIIKDWLKQHKIDNDADSDSDSDGNGHEYEYLAFFDRNADRVLDKSDVKLTKQDRRAGVTSTALDRELVELFWSTEMYRDLNQSIADGFIPFTQNFIGHGVHWARHILLGDLDYLFEVAVPEGLNYHPVDGRLMAVFYYNGPAGPNPADPDDAFNPFALAPDGFTGGHDNWHHHAGTCFGGLNYASPSYDPSTLNFLECLKPAECFYATGSTQTVWSPKFYMLHVWLYDLNPCGLFAGSHPHLTTGQDPATATIPHGISCDVFDVLP